MREFGGHGSLVWLPPCRGRPPRALSRLAPRHPKNALERPPRSIDTRAFRFSTRTAFACLLSSCPSHFVEAILAQAKERYTRQYALKRQGFGWEQVVARVADLCYLDPREVVARGRQQPKVTARSLLCFWAVRELGLPLTELARQLGLSPPGVSCAVQRGETLSRENHYELVA